MCKNCVRTVKTQSFANLPKKLILGGGGVAKLIERGEGKMGGVYTHISTSTNFIKILDLVINSRGAPFPWVCKLCV